MAQQVLVFLDEEEGWPLGLQILNVRVGLGGRRRSRDCFGSTSFNDTFASSSISCTDSSSDLDTQSTSSFFHQRTITLGSLMRASSGSEVSRRAPRDEPVKSKNKSRTWFLSLCSKDGTNVRNSENDPSLRQVLDMARRNRNSGSFIVAEEMSLAQHLNSVTRSLFVNGEIAPPHPHPRPRP